MDDEAEPHGSPAAMTQSLPPIDHRPRILPVYKSSHGLRQTARRTRSRGCGFRRNWGGNPAKPHVARRRRRSPGWGRPCYSPPSWAAPPRTRRGLSRPAPRRRSTTRARSGAGPIGNNNRYSAGASQVAMDGSGNAVALWTQSDGTFDGVWSSRFERQRGSARAPQGCARAIPTLGTRWRSHRRR